MDWNAKLFGLVPLWVLLVLGIGLLLFTLRGHIFRGVGRGVRRSPWIVPVVVVGVMVSLFWPVMHRWWTGGGNAMLLFLPLLWLAIAIPSIARGTRRLRQIEDNNNARRGNALLARLIVGNPSIGAIAITQLALWFLVITLSFVLAAFLAGKGLLAGVALLLLVGFLYAGHEVIPAEIPHRGVLTFLGKRTEVEMDEGLVLFFPFIESAFLVNIQKRDRDIVVRDVRTQDDAPLDVKVSVAWTPDPDRLRKYLQVGDKNIISLMESLVEQEVRIFFYSVPTWKLSEERIVDKHGTKEKVLLEPYQVALGMREKLTDLLINGMTAATNGRADLTADITAGGTGLQDNQGWAIRFQNTYVGPIILTGSLGEAAARRSTEAAERHGEVFEKETEALAAAELVAKYKSASGHDLDPAYALSLVMEYKAIMAGNGKVVSLSLSRMPTDVLEVLGKHFGKKGA